MAKAQRKVSPMIYVGPSFRDMDLHTYGIFANGVPKQYAGTIYATLFVTPEQLSKARAEIATKGSLLNTCYQRALKEHEKERN